MNPVIGIDLGTTNSGVAHLTANGPELIPNALGERLTPSVVGVDLDGKVVVGRGAKELQVLHPERCAALFKRYMGSDWRATIAGRAFSPEELSSLVLRALKLDAEAFFQTPITRAVITVPAYFNDRQRRATLNAGRIAGLSVERIFNEPTAAAVAYGFHEAHEDKKLLIIDLGGGTFDVSVVEIFEGTLEVRASAGESFLGGEDFTRTLAARVLETQGLVFERAELESPRLVSRLIQQCELAKCRLSRQETTPIRIPNREGEYDENSPEIDIARARFEAWTQHILGRMELPIRRVLADARLDKQDVDEVILVGGATRMPLVITRITELLGKSPHRRLNPDEVVALGAAVQGGLIAGEKGVEELVVTDVAPFTLGVEICKTFGQQHRDGYFLPVIQRNTTIPASRVQRVCTLAPNQTNVRVKVYQGESRRVEDNLLLGELEVRGIPVGPAGQEVDIRFTYDLNGVLEVEATIVATKKQVTHVIAHHAQGMSPAEVQRAVQAMSRLKTHPREQEANRYLLQRAERAYQEIGPEEREFLGQLLDAFEGALSSQEPVPIENCRTALADYLHRLDSGTDHPENGTDDDDWYRP